MNRRYGGIFLCLCGVSLLLCGCRKELCYDHDMHGLNVRVVVQPEWECVWERVVAEAEAHEFMSLKTIKRVSSLCSRIDFLPSLIGSSPPSADRWRSVRDPSPS